VSVTH